MKSNNKAFGKNQEDLRMTTENVCMMCVPRSAACCKKFLESCGFGEQGLGNIIQRTHEMLQEEQGKRNKRKGVEKGEGERRAGSGTAAAAALSLLTGGTGPCFETAHVYGKKRRVIKIFWCRSANTRPVCTGNRVTQPCPGQWLCLSTPST